VDPQENLSPLGRHHHHRWCWWFFLPFVMAPPKLRFKVPFNRQILLSFKQLLSLLDQLLLLVPPFGGLGFCLWAAMPLYYVLGNNARKHELSRMCEVATGISPGKVLLIEISAMMHERERIIEHQGGDEQLN
jgi:hypothetical protein